MFFSWIFSGDFDFVIWGFKFRIINDVNVILVFLKKVGLVLIFILFLYVGRVNGEWNNKILFGEVIFIFILIGLEDFVLYVC